MTTIASNPLDAFIFETNKKGGLSPEAQEKVNKAAADELNKPGARQVVADHLKNLTKTLKTIKSDFATIGTVLAGIDAKEIVKDVHGAAYLFSPRWRELFMNYNQILVRSQRSATDVKSSIQTLLLVIVPVAEDANISFPEKKAALAEYREYLAQYVDEESEIVTDLHRLSADIVSFKADLVDRLEGQHVATTETIKDLETKIEQLRQELIKENSRGFVIRALDAFKLSWRDFDIRAHDAQVASASADIATCFGFAGLLDFIPNIGLLTVAAAFSFLGRKVVDNFVDRASIQKEELNAQLEQRQNELRNEQANLGNLNAALWEVRALEGNFTSLLSQIKILTQINQMLLMDAGGVERALDKMAATNGQAIFKSLTGLLTSAYKTFDNSLTAYILAV